ncbi:MAG: NAD(P)-dependent glycerol-3-phosphate dehydrogenase [candidate division Zixibacteria bacterium]|nr:NAD(P)-dependent glycerol-3-phosphate dehydrogenase [candidate division Zixibacteria bacterium]
MFSRVAVLGAGSWGMATAGLLSNNGATVTLWEFDRAEYEKLTRLRAIPEKLQKFRLPEPVAITNSLDEALSDTELVVLVVPSQCLRSVLQQAKGKLGSAVGLVNLAKGIETTSLRCMSEVIADELGTSATQVATLSGPSHAEEVVQDMPTTVVVAGTDEGFVTRLQKTFSGSSFRVYSSHDLVGVELGGSLKNIIAIAVGIVDGLGLGDNTRGALITRGLAEMVRLGVALGAKAETFAGLSGIGDLVTTCTSQHSRNRHVGEMIGRGQQLEEILRAMAMVAEGVETTRSGYRLAELHRVEMPITTQIYQVLFENKSPSVALEELMGRELKAEIWR